MVDPSAPKPQSPADERRARLAQTLRANLKRRKQQSRQRSQEPAKPDGTLNSDPPTR